MRKLSSNEKGKILEEPDVPPQLIEKINDEKLCFFLGAGVSKLIGCRGWKETASKLVERCYQLGCINTFKKKDSILRIDNPKKVITICYNLLCKSNLEKEFFAEIEKSLIADPELVRKYNIYDELKGISAVYITTNIDNHFDKSFANRIIYDEKDFLATNIFPDKLYKIHGTIEKTNSVVFTVPTYFTRYRNPKFKAFLKQIFAIYSIVFLGYGLEEFEILDFLMETFSEEHSQGNHWILLPYYESEGYLKDYDEEYFSSLGINVIGYKKDQEGYRQLYKVIKKWNSEIKEISNQVFKKQTKMMNLVDKLPWKKK